MAESSGISWTDSTFNPWMGCTKVSPACDHCYAERDTKRFGRVEWGAGKPRVRTSVQNWNRALRWNRDPFYSCTACAWRGASMGSARYCPACGTPSLTAARRRVFCASLADWLDNEVPIDWLVDLLDLIRRTPNLDWLLLTKRIGNWRSRLEAARSYRLVQVTGRMVDGLTAMASVDWLDDWLDNGNPPANVWIGSTVINQDEADRDVPKLLAVPAAVRFLSIEPMLGPVRLSIDPEYGQRPRHPMIRGLDWVIVGGESGPHARPMQREWARSLRDQCQAAGVAFHFKQWGEWAPNWLYEDDNKTVKPGSEWMDRMGKKMAGRTLDGREWNEFPRSAA